MLKAKKKLAKPSKKELKQDKFVIATLKAKDYIEKNATKIAYAALAVVAVILLGYFYLSSKEKAEETATTLLSRAQEEFRNNQRESAIAIFTEVTREYDGTDAAGKAAFYLGKIYWEDNDLEQAKHYFELYIDDHDEKNILTQGAYAGYADCLAAEGNHAEAARYYEKAANLVPEFPQAAAYLYSAAQAYHEAGNQSKAKTLAKKVIDDYDDPSIENHAQILLETIEM